MNAGGASEQRRSILLIAEIWQEWQWFRIALTLTLLVGAGLLLIRTTFNLARVPLGYSTQNILAMSYYRSCRQHQTSSW